MTLKTRQPGQGTVEEVRMLDMRTELETKEKLHKEAQEKEASMGESIRKLHEAKTLMLGNGNTPEMLKQVAEKYDDSDESSSSSESDADSDEEEAELMRELEKIKKERLEAKLKTEESATTNSQEIMTGNPLLEQDNMSAALKRRWNDDVVFKNQSRDEPETKKRFINDVIRSDFHRSFLNKYIQ